MRKVALTTLDNPYDPIKQFDSWFGYDNALRYGTPQILARFCTTTQAQAEEDYWNDVEIAINEIMKNENFNHPDPFYAKNVYEGGFLVSKTDRNGKELVKQASKA